MKRWLKETCGRYVSEVASQQCPNGRLCLLAVSYISSILTNNAHRIGLKTEYWTLAISTLFSIDAGCG